MSRRKKGGGGGEECGSWMDTYGDMVTLLLCFFVMLYSMSDINQQKWEIFVKSIFPNAGDTQQIAINENIAEGEFDVSGVLTMEEEPTVEEEMDNLILSLIEALNKAGIDGASVIKGFRQARQERFPRRAGYGKPFLSGARKKTFRGRSSRNQAGSSSHLL